MATGRNIRAGGAYVELYTENRRMVRGLAMAQRRLQAFAAGATAIGKKLMMASAAVLGPLLASAKIFSKMGDNLHKMALRTGVSAEALSEMGFAAEQSGTDLATLEKGLRTMQRSVYDAGRGLATQTEALENLGLAVKDLQGLSPEKQFKLIADRIAGVEDPTRRAAVAMALLGKAGTSLLPMMLDGARGIEALQAEARKLGLTISTEDATAAADFTDTMNRMFKVIKTLVFSVGAELAPTLSKLAKNIMESAQSVRTWIRENGEAIVSTMKLAAKVALVGAGLVVLGAVLNATGVILGTLALAVKGVSVALAFLAANPLVIVMAGIMAAAILAGYALKNLTGDTARLSDEILRALDAGDRQRAGHQAQMNRLQELAEKTTLTASEQKEAREIIQQLESAYGDLGLSINSATGALEGFSAAQKEQNRQAREKKEAEIYEALAVREAEIRELTRKMVTPNVVPRWLEKVGIGDDEKARSEYYRPLIAEAEKARQALLERLKDDRPGAARVEQATPDVEDVNPEDFKADRVMDFEKSLARTIAELRIKAVEEGLQEELLLLKLRYEKELEMAKELGADLAPVREKYALLASEIHERHAREREQSRVARNEQLKAGRREDREEREEEKRERARSEFEIARLKIQLGKKGLAQQLALLDIEEKAALARGDDPKLTRQRIGLLRQLAKQRDPAALEAASPGVSMRGTFSAFGVRGLAAGGPLDRIAKTNQQIADDTRKLLKKAKPLTFT